MIVTAADELDSRVRDRRLCRTKVTWREGSLSCFASIDPVAEVAGESLNWCRLSVSSQVDDMNSSWLEADC